MGQKGINVNQLIDQIKNVFYNVKSSKTAFLREHKTINALKAFDAKRQQIIGEIESELKGLQDGTAQKMETGAKHWLNYSDGAGYPEVSWWQLQLNSLEEQMNVAKDLGQVTPVQSETFEAFFNYAKAMLSFVSSGIENADADANATFNKYFDKNYLVDSTLQQSVSTYERIEEAWYNLKYVLASWNNLDVEYTAFYESSQNKLSVAESSRDSLDTQAKALRAAIASNTKEISIQEAEESAGKAELRILVANQVSAESLRADYQKQLENLDPAAANYATELERLSGLIATVTADLAALYPQIAEIISTLDSIAVTLDNLYASLKAEEGALSVVDSDLAVVIGDISSIKNEMEKRADDYKFAHAAIVIDYKYKQDHYDETVRTAYRIGMEMSNFVGEGLISSEEFERARIQANFSAKRKVWGITSANDGLNYLNDLDNLYKALIEVNNNIEAVKVAFANRMQDATGSYVKAVQFLQDVNAKIAYVTSEIERLNEDKGRYEYEVEKYATEIALIATLIANKRAEFDALTVEIEAAAADRSNQSAIITDRASQINAKNEAISLLDPTSETYDTDKSMLEAEIAGLEAELVAAQIAYDEADATFNSKTQDRWMKDMEINSLVSEQTTMTAEYDGYVVALANTNETLAKLNEKAVELPTQKADAEGAVAEINTVINDIQASYAEQHGAYTSELEGVQTLIKNGVAGLNANEERMGGEIDAIIESWSTKKDDTSGKV